ncbi:glycoside hydrolase family 6 protein [Microbacterium oleivorans]|uniref:glycoside hydrolase family 6 protein n=1 Tax=Microbacterium oleivorans TaxID=273677 RepID=UPI001F414EDA|nr:glycoside hydrolase family 6 protein [Microbacterium oleivorans]
MAPRKLRMPPARVLVPVAIVVALVLVLVLVGVIGSAVTRGFHALTAQPPHQGTMIIAPTQAKAAAAARDLSGDEKDAADYLAAQPTAYWLTPEQDPIGTAGGTVLDLISQARDQNRSVAVVIYGLPGRDCGNHSAGGLSEADYPTWVGEIGAALDTAPEVQKIVVLEPDSIALSDECGNIAERARQLSTAVDELTTANTWIYIDGGHSNWLPAEKMADLIRQTSVIDRVRGFATNVSNYQASADEFAYAASLSSLLGGAHAIVDTSRNGVASSGGEWCNPPGQRVGEPGGSFHDDVVDTNLWIKPAGESDGECSGGPAAGIYWPEAGVELTQGVR